MFNTSSTHVSSHISFGFLSYNLTPSSSITSFAEWWRGSWKRVQKQQRDLIPYVFLELGRCGNKEMHVSLMGWLLICSGQFKLLRTIHCYGSSPGLRIFSTLGPGRMVEPP
jgi:hypothetical protein